MVKDLQGLHDLQDPAKRDFVVSLLSLQDLSLHPVSRALYHNSISLFQLNFHQNRIAELSDITQNRGHSFQIP